MVTVASPGGLAFFETLRAAFAVAARGAGVERRRLRLGRSRATLEFAGSALLEAFGPAFRHLEATGEDAAAPDGLTVLLWDTRSTGVAPPKPPWEPGQFLARGEIGHDFGDRIRLSFRIDSGVLSTYDPESRTAICWVRDPAQMPPWEEAAPLRPVLAWWAEGTGRQLAHGAAVGSGDGAVLLAARGGSGKSTTALSCLEHGLLYLGDDYVMLEPGRPPRLGSLYSTAKLTPANLDARLPRLRALVAGRHDAGQDKLTLSLFGGFAPQLAASLPLVAVVVPAVARRGSPRLTPLSGAAALAALAPTTLFQLPDAGAAALDRMRRLIDSVPRYRLELAEDLAANVAAIRGLLAGAPSP